MKIIIEAHKWGEDFEEADMFHKGYTIDKVIETLNELRASYGGDCKVFTVQCGRKDSYVYGVITKGDIHIVE